MKDALLKSYHDLMKCSLIVFENDHSTQQNFKIFIKSRIRSYNGEISTLTRDLIESKNYLLQNLLQIRIDPKNPSKACANINRTHLFTLEKLPSWWEK